MSDPSTRPNGGTEHDPADADPIDVEAAQIDARSPDAAEDVAGLAEHADELGRDRHVPPAGDSGEESGED
jgi:hypothetical protein